MRVQGPATSSRRVSLTAAYRRLMAIARRSEGRRGPAQPPEGLDRYEGLWVAVQGGRVIAAAATTRELVYSLAKIGPRAKGATLQRVPRRADGLVVGMG